MANRPAPGLVLHEGDRERLQALIRSSTAPAGLVQRARIVLLAADGESNTAIADKVGVSRPTVLSWRERYRAKAYRAWTTSRARGDRPVEGDRDHTRAAPGQVRRTGRGDAGSRPCWPA